MSSQRVHEAIIVADYLLAHSDVPLTSLHLNKITYVCHAWCLAGLDKPLIYENVEAWKFGPVIASLYHALKRYGREPISKLISSDVYLTNRSQLEIEKIKLKEKFVSEELEIIDTVLKTYKNYSGAELIQITHEKDAPWDSTFNKKVLNLVISNEKIKTHFKKYLDD